MSQVVFLATRTCQGTVSVEGPETGTGYAITPHGASVNWRDAPGLMDMRWDVWRGDTQVSLPLFNEVRASSSQCPPELIISGAEARQRLTAEQERQALRYTQGQAQARQKARETRQLQREKTRAQKATSHVESDNETEKEV